MVPGTNQTAISKRGEVMKYQYSIFRDADKGSRQQWGYSVLYDSRTVKEPDKRYDSPAEASTAAAREVGKYNDSLE